MAVLVKLLALNIVRHSSGRHQPAPRQGENES